MSDYVIVQCRKTLDLILWGGERFGIWTPTDITVTGRKPSLPGYAFVPRQNFHIVRRLCPSSFNIRPLQYDATNRPVGCSLNDLKRMEAALTTPAMPAPETLSSGDLVEIANFGAFTGFTARFIAYKSCGRCRVQFENTLFGFTNIPVACIRSLQVA